MNENIVDVRKPYAQVAAAIASGQPTGLYDRTFLETLDGMSAQEYNQLFKGRIKNAIDTIRFDTLRIIGGTAIGAGDKSLFNVAVNGTGTSADGGTSYKKNKFDTNMKVANEMEYENILIVESFQCEVILTAQLPTADTVNVITDPTAASAAATTAAASINMYALCHQSWVTFTVGDRTVLEGRVVDFPSQGGIWGFAGGADEGVVQNGLGFGRPLREIVILRPGEQFGVTVNFPVSFTPTQDINLVVKLCGVRLRPVG